MVITQSRNEQFSYNIHFQVQHTSICFWSCSHVKWCGIYTAYTCHTFKSSVSMEWMLSTNTSIIWTGCYTINKQSVRIIVANVFTIILVLTVRRLPKPSNVQSLFAHQETPCSICIPWVICLLTVVIPFHRWLFQMQTKVYRSSLFHYQFQFYIFRYSFPILHSLRGKMNNFT